MSLATGIRFASECNKEISITRRIRSEECRTELTSYPRAESVQSWLGNYNDPEDWGWKKCGKLLMPVQNSKPPAPPELLKLIFCKCKGNCGAITLKVIEIIQEPTSSRSLVPFIRELGPGKIVLSYRLWTPQELRKFRWCQETRNYPDFKTNSNLKRAVELLPFKAYGPG
ncbi:hypothetical protein EVAR_22450_1 [Eumeta japonica]|uniref:Uncharacterized protein n=1 Tax=Eumeta variegata TaxID=151549 RepID=A0A4C1VB05_EUMVA|nr:hypothetical protein EVAR_22450_1 [Eumeta japonica]